jgi:hypothetical protein
MKHTIILTFAAAIMMAAAACGSHRQVPDGHATSALTKVADSFDYLRKHVKDELAGTENIQPWLKDSIVLDGTKGTGAPHFKLADEDMWASFQFSVYAGNKKLYLYNVEDKKVVRTIDLSKTYDNDYKVDCYVKSNIIYTVKWSSNDMRCFDFNGRPLHTHHFPDYSKELDCRLTAYPYRSPFNLNRNNDMVMYMAPYLKEAIKEIRAKILKHKPIALLHIGAHGVRLKNWLGTAPKEYLDHYYYDMRPNFINISDSAIASVFDIFPGLYIQNTYNGKLQQYTIKGMPKNRVNPISEDPEKLKDFSYTTEQEIKNDCYMPFAYDAERKRYYIFRGLGIAPVNEDGSLALYDDKPLILYVVDAATNSVIKKLNFGLTGKYSWYCRPVIYKNKMYMIRKKGHKRDEPIKIDVYEIP